jgi:hypothetical protein
MEGIIGTKMSIGDTLRAAAARTVDPPHGTVLSTPLAVAATTVSTTGLIPSRR